jgi:hypothetical protein
MCENIPPNIQSKPIRGKGDHHHHASFAPYLDLLVVSLYLPKPLEGRLTRLTTKNSDSRIRVNSLRDLNMGRLALRGELEEVMGPQKNLDASFLKPRENGGKPDTGEAWIHCRGNTKLESPDRRRRLDHGEREDPFKFTS